MTTATFVGTLAFAASAGVTTFFAPCAFPLLPGYVGYYVQQSEGDALGLPSAAAAGTGSLLTLGVVAGIAFAFGRTLTSVLPLFEPLVGMGLIVFGSLILVDLTPAITPSLPQRPESVFGFGMFGAAYAIAAAGCVLPLFLGVTTQAATLPVLEGVTVLTVYAAAVTGPLVGVSLLTGVGVEVGQDLGRFTGRIKQAAAGIMILAGIGQLYLSIVILDVV